MRRVLSLSVALLMVCLFVSGSCLAKANVDEIIITIVEARSATKPFVLPSSQIPDLDVKKAYGLQRKLVEAILKKGESINGFKAALTSEGAQKKFGAKGPLLGPLFKGGLLKPGATVDRKDFVRLFIEAEVGYIVGKEITKPVKDVASLKKLIKGVCPTIELPDIRFKELKGLKPADIAFDTAGSAKYIIGKPVAVDKMDLNKVAVSMTLDGKEVVKGLGKDAMGDQWKALLWLVNGAIEQGWTLKPDQVLITGSLGKMIPGKPGKYEAKFGDLGEVSFTVN
ncbi:2-keto-4-pentenoate hydratase [Thermodesulfobacteriota bacterium]